MLQQIPCIDFQRLGNGILCLQQSTSLEVTQLLIGVYANGAEIVLIIEHSKNLLLQGIRIVLKRQDFLDYLIELLGTSISSYCLIVFLSFCHRNNF